jgi:hypothetical protein
MTGEPIAASVTEQVDEQSRLAQLKNTIVRSQAVKWAVGGAAGLLLIGGAYEAGQSSNSNAEAQGQGSTPTATEYCGNITLTDSVDQLAQFKFLSSTKSGSIKSSKEAANYSQSLFDKNGPLAGEADNRASASIVDAVFVSATANKNFVNEDDMHTTFNNDMAALNRAKVGKADQADKYAKNLCEKENAVLGVTEAYEANAINVGDQIIEVIPVESKDGIKDFTLKHSSSPKTIGGLTYRLRLNKQTVQINGKEVELNGSAGTITLPGDGSIYIVNSKLPTGGEKPEHNNNPAGQKPKHHKAPAGDKPNHNKTPAGHAVSKKQAPSGKNVRLHVQGGGGAQGIQIGNKKHEKNEAPVQGPIQVNRGRHNTPTPTAPQGPRVPRSAPSAPSSPSSPSPQPSPESPAPAPQPQSQPPAEAPKGSAPQCVSNPPYVVC